MRRAALLLMAILLAVDSVALSAARAADADQGSPDRPTLACVVDGPPARFAPRIEEFGSGGDPVTTTADETYQDGRGFQFLYERREKDAFQTEAGGGYLAGGLVLAPDASGAAADLHTATTAWLSSWDAPDITRGTIGDENLTAQRTTPWKVAPGRPMVEVFIAFRLCNASAHVLVAVMPDFDPLDAAQQYAEAIEARVRAEAVAVPASATIPEMPVSLPRPLHRPVAQSTVSSASMPRRCAISEPGAGPSRFPVTTAIGTDEGSASGSSGRPATRSSRARGAATSTAACCVPATSQRRAPTSRTPSPADPGIGPARHQA